MRTLRGKMVLVALVLAAGSCSSSSAEVKAVAVSGRSPFRSCSFQAPIHNPNSRMILDSEVEPSLAISPKDPNVLIGVYQQDRWSGGQARGIVASVSHDGGRRWRQVPLPMSQCARASVPAPRAGDPWVSIGPDGTAYVIGIGTGVEVTTSRDGGVSWIDPASLDERTDRYFPDKPSITAAPHHAGVAYAVWARAITSQSLDAVFSKTTDFGRSWSPAAVLIKHGHESGPIAGQILVAPESTLYHLTTWDQHAAPGPGPPVNVMIQRSADGGQTWSAPETAFEERTTGYSRSGARGSFIRAGTGVPDFAIDSSTGTLYAVWQDARFSGGRRDEVAFSRSTDGGHTWSLPKRVNRATGDVAATPALAMGRTGEVGVSYYSFHIGSEKERPRIDGRVFLAVSRDGGETFSTEQLAGPVDIRQAPQVLAPEKLGGDFYFLGDYEGLEPMGSSFAALFALPNPGRHDRADVFFARSSEQA